MGSGGNVTLRDVTLREGLDVPGMSFSPGEQLRIAGALNRLGIKEAEIGAPFRLAEVRRLHEAIKDKGWRLKTSGLVFGFGKLQKELVAGRFLDRVDILMPLLSRGPKRSSEKIRSLTDAISEARSLGLREVGAGLPHAASVSAGLVNDMVHAAKGAGACRVILYDTNGSAQPTGFSELVASLSGVLPLHVHCHNDLGLALANSLAAVEAGAVFIDCSMNGLGDRAGNCATEPLAANLELRGIDHGLGLAELKRCSDEVAQIAGLRSPLFPVTGDFAFAHTTKTHKKPALFEALPPGLVGAKRTIHRSAPGGAVLAAIEGRRSVRKFRDQKIEPRLLRAVLQSALLAPSSLNGRPWHLVVIEDKAVIQELVELKNRHVPEAKKDYPADFLLAASCVIVVCVDKEKSFGRELENAVLATANMMLAARACGLGTTYLSAYRPGQPSLERRIKELLRLPKDVMPVTILPIGYPMGTPVGRRAPALRPRLHRNRW